jgi:YceI-like domain
MAVDRRRTVTSVSKRRPYSRCWLPPDACPRSGPLFKTSERNPCCTVELHILFRSRRRTAARCRQPPYHSRPISRTDPFLDGNLTIRGITKAVTLALETPEFGASPQGGTKAGFSATTDINRTDFGVSYNGPIPGGGVALGEKVQIVLEIEADLNP